MTAHYSYWTELGSTGQSIATVVRSPDWPQGRLLQQPAGVRAVGNEQGNVYFGQK